MPRLVLLLMLLIPERMSAAQQSLFRDCLVQIFFGAMETACTAACDPLMHTKACLCAGTELTSASSNQSTPSSQQVKNSD